MDIFIKDDDIKYSTITISNFKNVQKNSIINLSTVSEKYKDMVSRVNNDNVFVKIINDLYIEESNVLDYIFKIRARKDYVIRNSKVVTTGSKGDVLKDEIMINAKEVFVSVDKDLELDKLVDIQNNWKNIEAVNVLYHCYSGLNFNGLNNKLEYTDNENENVNIYAVDVVLLMLQYRCYMKNAIAMDRGISIAEFVFRYVYTNMSRDMLNLSILNSYIEYNMDNIVFNTVEARNRLPMVLLGMDSMFNSYMLDFGNKLDKLTKKDYNFIFYNLKLINTNALEFLDLSRFNTSYSSINRWAMVYSRLRYIYFVISYLGKSSFKLNNDYIARLRTLIKMYKRENSNIPKELLKDYNNYLELIENKIKE